MNRPLDVADAHSDLLVDLAHRKHEPDPFGRGWLSRMRDGGVRLQVCAVSARLEDMPELALRRTLDQVTALYRALDEHPGEIRLVTSRDDVAADDPTIGLVLAVEGAEAFGYDPQMSEIYWQLGARMFSLTWNRRNPFADGVAERPGAGLSRIGRDLVDRMARRGAIIDLSHASEATFRDVTEHAAQATLVVSHVGCRAVNDTPRNLADWQLEAIAERDGLVGMMALPFTVDPAQPTIDRFVDHVAHAIAVIGDERVAIGADFFRDVARSGAVRMPPDTLRPSGMTLDAAIEGLTGPEHFPSLTAALQRRGFDAARIHRVMFENLRGFMEHALPGAEHKRSVVHRQTDRL